MPTWRKNEENKEYTCGSYTIKPDKKGGYSAYKLVKENKIPYYKPHKKLLFKLPEL